MTKDEEQRFEALRKAYLRGIEWAKENGFNPGYAAKAAYDYADKNTPPEDKHNDQ